MPQGLADDLARDDEHPLPGEAFGDGAEIVEGRCFIHILD